MSFKEDVRKSLHSIDTTLAAQHESIKDHIRRTELLEEAIEPLKKQHAIIKVLMFLASGAAVELIHRMIK
jgi:hypothetical protein